MTEYPECFKCGYSSGQSEWREALVKIYSSEEEDVEIVDGKRDPTYETKERWCCLECLLTRVASNAFEAGMEMQGVDLQ